ncbi:MAG: hypothetical protein WCB14_09435 [Candidatus Acidiferrales bacterium]
MPIKRIAFAVAFILLGAISASAQTDPNLEQGIKPFGAYDSSDTDSISMVNGGLTLNIPLFRYSQRGSKLSLDFRMMYSSRGWTESNTQEPPIKVTFTGGSESVGIGDTDLWVFGLTPKGCTNGGVNALSGYLDIWPSITGVDGSTHPVGLTSYNLSTRQFNFESLDGTGLKLSGFTTNSSGQVASPGSITDKDGTSFFQYWTSFPTYAKEDANGNVILENSSGYTDTLGRSVPAGVSATDTTGCTGPLAISSALLWSFPGPSGGNTEIKICYATVAIQTNFISSTEQDILPSFSAIQSVIAYNNSSWTTSPSWTFQYSDRNPGDPSNINYGSLTSVTLPNGGTITYTYTRTTAGGTGWMRGVASKTVNANDGTGNHTWNYSYHVGSVLTNTVTDPLGNDTVYTMTGLGGSLSFYPTEVDYYQGSDLTGDFCTR